MKTKNTQDKLLIGIEKVLGSWPLLRGVVETSWKEHSFRKIDELKDYFEAGKYKFHTLSNRQLEKVFAEELHFQITSDLIRL
jgi:hypothetical protein